VLKQYLPSSTTNTEKVKKLNTDLDAIKKLLEDYLKHIRQNEINPMDSIYFSIYAILKLRDFTFNGFNAVIEEEYQEFIKIEEQIKTGKEPEYYQSFSKIKDWADDIKNKILNKDYCQPLGQKN
jgi:hypothetical protein